MVTGRVLMVILCGVLAGCGSSRQTVQASSGPFQVSVLPAGPPTWTYTVQTDRANGIVSIDVITELDRKLCRIEPDATAPGRPAYVAKRRGIGVRTPEAVGLRRVSFSVVAKQSAPGLVYIEVTDTDGISARVGPIAGPVPLTQE